MDDHSRLTFLTRYYYNLQGVRFAPLWIAGPFIVFAWMPYYAKHDHLGWGAFCYALGAVLAIQVLWYSIATLFYRRRFGWLKPDPFRFAKPKTNRPLWWVFMLSLTVWAIYCRTNHSAAFFPYFLAFIFTQPVYNVENPPIRRIAYGVGAALIAAAALLNWFNRADGIIFFATLCVIMLALGVADHLLLLGLLTPPRENADA
jgi:MFS family permease